MGLLKLLVLGARNLSTSPNLKKCGPNSPYITAQFGPLLLGWQK